MKSLQQDNKIIRTSCKNCVFAEYKDNTQISCIHGRIDKFKNLSTDDFSYVTEAYDDEKEFFVVNRLCTLYRDKDSWNNGNINVEKALEEIKISFDLLINCDNIDNVQYYQYIQRLLIEAIFYGENKFNIHLYHNQSLDKDSRKNLLTLKKGIKKSDLSIYYNKSVLEHNVISKSRNSYHIKIDHDHIVDVDIFQKLNDIIHNDLKKILVCKNRNTYIISNLSYKIENDGKINPDLEQSLQNIINYAKADFYIEI